MNENRQIFAILDHGQKDLYVEVSDWRGLKMVTVKDFLIRRDGTEMPTRNGINFPINMLEGVISGLLQVHIYAEQQGWIPPLPRTTQEQKCDLRSSKVKVKPRKPNQKALAVQELRSLGYNADEIAEQLGISRATVYRCFNSLNSSGETSIDTATESETATYRH